MFESEGAEQNCSAIEEKYIVPVSQIHLNDVVIATG